MQGLQKKLIWDLPTRLFHWTLALSFAGAWLSSDSDQWRSVHVFLGYLMLGLVGFRVIWGLVGSHYARFASFWFGPRDALVYLRQVLAGKAQRHVGHNPTGSLAIYLLLLLTLVIGITGVLTLGGDEQQGLAAGWFSFEQIRGIKKLHELLAIVMLLLVGGHLAGVLVESVQHRENLARSMVTGTKLSGADTPLTQARALVALGMAVLMLVFGLWWFYYAIDARLDQVPAIAALEKGGLEEPHVKFVGAKLPDNAQWREECGSCHVAFYPALLPSRSWRRLMTEQDKHFGTDLALDAATQTAILSFLGANAAEKHLTEAGFKIDSSLKPDAVPLRITETPYWVKKHREISNSDWLSPKVKSKTNCDSCHVDAKDGTFEDAAMQIPAREPMVPSPARTAP